MPRGSVAWRRLLLSILFEEGRDNISYLNKLSVPVCMSLPLRVLVQVSWLEEN